MQVLANRTTEAQNWVTALMDNMDHGLFTGLLNQSNNFVNLIYSSSFNPNKQAITAYSNTLKNHVKSYHRPSTTSSSITLEPCVVQTCPKLKKKNPFLFRAAFYCHICCWIANHHSNTVTQPTSNAHNTWIVWLTILLKGEKSNCKIINRVECNKTSAVGSLVLQQMKSPHVRDHAPNLSNKPRAHDRAGTVLSELIPLSNAANFSLRTTDDGWGTKA